MFNKSNLQVWILALVAGISSSGAHNEFPNCISRRVLFDYLFSFSAIPCESELVLAFAVAVEVATAHQDNILEQKLSLLIRMLGSRDPDLTFQVAID
jgi:hypothetical protein